jgi:5,10-methylenetetrahydromethanopterin reductase
MATINEISGGRAIMNIGAGDRPVTEMGLPFARVAVVREAMTLMRLLTKGKPVDFQGETFQLHEGSLRHGRFEDIRFFMTASGPRMLELAGEIADGVIFLSGSFRAGVDFALSHIAVGAERSRRALSDLTLGCAVYGAIDENIKRARQACRPIAAWFPQTSPQYARLLGVDDPTIDAIRQVYRGGHFDESTAAFDLVTDDMVDAFALAGGRDHWLERILAIADAGVDFVVVFPMVADKMPMVERLAAEIVPEFSG